MPSFSAPKGTRDVVPPESDQWVALVGRFADQMQRAGYGLLQSPMFEEIGVFERIGEGTDVVSKEMYDFDDKGGRHIALRPEGTASAVRAYLELRPTPPWKVWYAAPSFRYESPQAGRYRQHHQLGAEAIGSADPDLDVEVVAVAWDFLTGLGLERLTLALNSLGEPEARAAYVEALRDYLRGRQSELAEEDRERVEAHPMRVLDSRRAESAAVVDEAPVLADHLSAEAKAHFDRVQEGLTRLGIPLVVEPRLVRGLDYYTHTTFEMQAESLDAAQNAVGGGGRYDGLAEALGGPQSPGVGFAIGIERTLAALASEGSPPEPGRGVEVFVVDVAGGDAARDLTAELRRAGIGADRAFDGRSMKAQMKAADRSGARLAMIVGDDERAAGTVTVRDLRGGDVQETVASADVVSYAREKLA